MEGKNQEQASAAAGISTRTGQRWERGELPTQRKRERGWRTRADPFVDVWESDVVPLLEADKKRKLQAKTVLKELRRRHPGRFPRSMTRTLQRRMRDWRALHGPDQEVVFPQEHPPGREAAFDFTHTGELKVTVCREAFDHLLFTLKASCGKRLYAELAYGETWEALNQGLQNAMWSAGGVYKVWRSDNLSAATKELKRTGGRALTKRYAELLDHYGAKSTRIKPGKAKENGGAEKANDLLKTALEQALQLRGYRDFESVEAYAAFVDGVVAEHNAEHAATIEAERSSLESLPSCRLPVYTVFTPTVRSWSTIRVGKRWYSVPSRLIGHELEVRQYPNTLEVYYQGKLTLELPRLRGSDVVRVDYRHVIWSLVRKPGAFARYKFREELFPTLVFRRAYDALVTWRGERADVEYVRILHLAASTMQGPVQRALSKLLEGGERFDYVTVKALAAPEPISVPDVKIGTVDLPRLDRLLRVAR
ncbi:MAG: IS21 family transposase [bacterium]|nr:IS21 family transposase [bacterium]